MSEVEYALSIMQPWAWAILHAGKTVENRSWPTRFRGRIIIHTGRKVDEEGLEWLKLQGYDVPPDLPTGAYVGEVTIGDCCPADALFKDRWVNGPWCYTLHLPEAYATPIPAKGRLGIYRVREEAR